MEFEEKLITAISQRPFIYDKKLPHYSQRTHISSAWAEISEEVGNSVKSCKLRWRSLKDGFYKIRRQLHRKHKNSGNDIDDAFEQPSWKWYPMLLFLKEFNDFNESERPEVNVMIDEDDEYNSKSCGEDTRIIPDERKKDVDRCSEFVTTSGGTAWMNKKIKLDRDASQYNERVVNEPTIGPLIQTQIKNDAVIVASSSINSTFVQYIGAEMDTMSTIEQEDFKFDVMNILRKIKLARRNVNIDPLCI